MRATYLLQLLLLYADFSLAASVGSGKWCFAGCEFTLNYARFNDTDPASKKVASCRSTLRATSLYLCIQEYCTEVGREEWLRAANETCQSTANSPLPPYDIIAKYGPEEIEAMRRLSADDAFKIPILEELVLPDQAFFDRAYTTLDAAYFEYDIHKVYGWILFYFWAVVLSVGIGSRLLSLFYNIQRQGWQRIPTHPDEPGQSPALGTSGKIYAFLKRHITIPATFNNRCSEPLGWCTIPPRVQSLTILAFVLLNVLVCMISYRVTHGNLYWPLEYIQLWRYVSDRTGILSLMNFPLIWLFGMRNDALIWMTGWGFGTYNNFHRWVARVSTVQAVVHSVGYTVMIWEGGGWNHFQKYLGKHYFWNGELATIFMCALLAFSVYGLRRSHYEVFLFLHIIFSIIVLLTMYYHIAIFVSGEWDIFIYPCIGVWIVDRFLRAWRILAFNPRFWNTKATAAYDASSHLVRLDVSCDQSLMEPKPGTYYYIYVLNNLLYAHQNHPFTLAYVATDKAGRETAMPRLPPHRPSVRRTISVDSIESTESDALLSPTTSSPTSPSLVFLVRPYDGFTSRLAEKASSGSTSLRVLVEGPYGHTVPLREYPSILFMIGGTGIAVPLSHLASLLSEGSAVMNVRIVWAVRELTFLASVLDEFRTLLEDERVLLVAHVTQNAENKDDVLDDAIKHVRIKTGRPDVGGVVEEAASEAANERLAVVACGPAKMADATRKACVKALGEGYKRVEYFEESFKW